MGGYYIEIKILSSNEPIDRTQECRTWYHVSGYMFEMMNLKLCPELYKFGFCFDMNITGFYSFRFQLYGIFRCAAGTPTTTVPRPQTDTTEGRNQRRVRQQQHPKLRHKRITRRASYSA